MVRQESDVVAVWGKAVRLLLLLVAVTRGWRGNWHRFGREAHGAEKALQIFRLPLLLLPLIFIEQFFGAIVKLLRRFVSRGQLIAI